MKRLIIMLLCLSLIMINTLSMKATTIKNYYPHIKMNVPIIDQERQGCAIASMASIEAYFYKEASQNYSTSKIYAQVKKQNQGGILAYWYRIGYEVKNVDSKQAYLQALYNELASGYPVIVFRNSTHYSICYGYNGPKDQLLMEGFMIADVAVGVEKYVDLKTWMGSYQPSYDGGYDYVVRKQGLKDASMLVNDIVFAINHPSKIDEVNTGVFVYGNITSNYPITNLDVKVYDANQKVKFQVQKKLNTKNYDVSNLDNDLAFRSLPNGYYTYELTALNSNGIQKTYAYQFSKSDQVYHKVNSYTLLHDLQVNQWYYEVANDAFEYQIMSGIAPNIFGGDHTMSRGMVASVIFRMSGIVNYPYRYVFWDVANHYYGSAITWGHDEKIFNGNPGGSFHPDEDITREQLIVMLRNYANYLNIDTSSDQSLNEFIDHDQINDYALSAMKWAVEQNLISGTANKALNPNQAATRAEAAKILVQFYRMIKK